MSTVKNAAAPIEAPQFLLIAAWTLPPVQLAISWLGNLAPSGICCPSASPLPYSSKLPDVSYCRIPYPQSSTTPKLHQPRFLLWNVLSRTHDPLLLADDDSYWLHSRRGVFTQCTSRGSRMPLQDQFSQPFHATVGRHPMLRNPIHRLYQGILVLSFLILHLHAHPWGSL